MATPKMTRSHFQFIADVLLEKRPATPESEEYKSWRSVVLYFANELRYTNPQFKTDTFLEACGV
jgi:hypothetical protein